MTEDIKIQNLDTRSSRSLYYDFGYLPANVKENNREEIIQQNFIIYLLGISLALNFIGQIPFLLTSISVVVYFFLHYNFKERVKKTIDYVMLLIIFLLAVFDHIRSSVIILPGEVFTGSLTIVSWILELMWIITFGLQALIVIQPTTQKITVGKTIEPVSSKAKKNLNSLTVRLSGSEYEISDLSDNIDTNLIKATFTNLIKYLFGILTIVILLDTLLWQVVNSLAGGNNIFEIYIVSGMSLFLTFLLIFISSWIGTENKTLSENEN